MKIAILLILLLLSSLTVIMLPEHAYASDVQITCDLRILQLTDEQRNQIRTRRQQYKQEQRQNNHHQTQTNNQLSLRNFFTKSAFDNQQAGEIAKQRYADDMRQAIAELSFYHDVFQLLDVKQREIWLQKCMQTQGRI